MSNKKAIGREPHWKTAQKKTDKKVALGKGLANQVLLAKSIVEMAKEHEKNHRYKEAALAYAKARRKLEASECAVDFSMQMLGEYVENLKDTGRFPGGEQEKRDFQEYLSKNGAEEFFCAVEPDGSKRNKWKQFYTDFCNKMIAGADLQSVLEERGILSSEKTNDRGGILRISGCFGSGPFSGSGC